MDTISQKTHIVAAMNYTCFGILSMLVMKGDLWLHVNPDTSRH